MIIIHLVIQTLTLSSGFALWLILTLSFLREMNLDKAMHLIFHLICSAYIMTNIFLFLSFNLESLYMKPMASGEWRIFYFTLLPLLFRSLRALLLFMGFLIILRNSNIVKENRRISLTVGLLLFVPGALTVVQLTIVRQPLNPTFVIYGRLTAYFLLNLIFFFRLNRQPLNDRARENRIKQSYEKELSKREKEVFGQLLSHCSYKEIAETMHISVDTVKSHASRIYKKTQVSGRNELLKTIEKEG